MLKLLDLPNEVLGHIIGCLPNTHEQLKHISSICLVNHRFNEIASPYLYRHVTILFDEFGVSPAAISSFVVEFNPRNFAHVREISIRRRVVRLYGGDKGFNVDEEWPKEPSDSVVVSLNSILSKLKPGQLVAFDGHYSENPESRLSLQSRSLKFPKQDKLEHIRLSFSWPSTLYSLIKLPTPMPALYMLNDYMEPNTKAKPDSSPAQSIGFVTVDFTIEKPRFFFNLLHVLFSSHQTLQGITVRMQRVEDIGNDDGDHEDEYYEYGAEEGRNIYQELMHDLENTIPHFLDGMNLDVPSSRFEQLKSLRLVRIEKLGYFADYANALLSPQALTSLHLVDTPADKLLETHHAAFTSLHTLQLWRSCTTSTANKILHGLPKGLRHFWWIHTPYTVDFCDYDEAHAELEGDDLQEYWNNQPPTELCPSASALLRHKETLQSLWLEACGTFENSPVSISTVIDGEGLWNEDRFSLEILHQFPRLKELALMMPIAEIMETSLPPSVKVLRILDIGMVMERILVGASKKPNLEPIPAFVMASVSYVQWAFAYPNAKKEEIFQWFESLQYLGLGKYTGPLKDPGAGWKNLTEVCTWMRVGSRDQGGSGLGTGLNVVGKYEVVNRIGTSGVVNLEEA